MIPGENTVLVFIAKSTFCESVRICLCTETARTIDKDLQKHSVYKLSIGLHAVSELIPAARYSLRNNIFSKINQTPSLFVRTFHKWYMAFIVSFS